MLRQRLCAGINRSPALREPCSLPAYFRRRYQSTGPAKRRPRRARRRDASTNKRPHNSSEFEPYPTVYGEDFAFSPYMSADAYPARSPSESTADALDQTRQQSQAPGASFEATNRESSPTANVEAVLGEATGEASHEPSTRPRSRGGVWTSLQARLHASGPRNEAETETPEIIKDSVGEQETPIASPSASRASQAVQERRRKRENAVQTPKSRQKSKAKSSGDQKQHLEVKRIRPQKIPFTPVQDEAGGPEVPLLAHNLDRVLFNPGVYQMQDARSRVFNFDPYLASIMPVDEFDFAALKEYITSSKDTKLREMSAAHGRKYCGSTSSLTAMLSHFHYLLSAWRAPSFENISRSFVPDSKNFTRILRAPAAAVARLEDGVYAIDADKEYDRENILSMLGKSMEKLLTLPKDEFEKYRLNKSHQISEEERNASEPYHYGTLGDFMLRSQLDARDPRLPGTGVFDLKTRAVISIRMDVQSYEKGQGYEIRNRFGQFESFEREYFDMIRAAFLKYSLQVRMGCMDGIYVAFHNTQRIFGFQYIPLEEMDQAIHGTSDKTLGDEEFRASVALLNELLNRGAEKFPGRSLRLHVETRATKVPLMYFFVEPVTEEDMEQSKENARRSVERVEDEIKGLSERERQAESMSNLASDEHPPSDEAPLGVEKADETATDIDQDDAAVGDVWEELMSKVEETVENDSKGVGSVREALLDALEQADLLRNKTKEEGERYLDALVESLISKSAGLKETREAWDADGASSTVPDASALTDHSPEHGSVDAGKPNSETAEDSSSKETPKLRTSQASLSNLIIKVAEGVDDRSRDLTDFERTLSEMSTHAKQPQVDIEINGTTGGESPPDEGATEAGRDDEASLNSEVADSRSETGGQLVESSTGESTVEEIGEDSALDDTSGEPATSNASPSPENRPTNVQKPSELLGMYITIRNSVSGKYVERPVERPRGWQVQYTISEFADGKAREVYASLRKRRKAALADDSSKAGEQRFRSAYLGKLNGLSKRGEKYRHRFDEEQRGKSVFVAWDNEPQQPETSISDKPESKNDGS